MRLLFGGVLVERWTTAASGTADKSFALVNQAQEQYQEALRALRDLVVLDALEVKGIEKDEDMKPEEHKLALAQATQVLNKGHYMLADCLCKIARLANRSGDFESSQHHYAEAAEYIETHIGASHPLASEAFLGLGMLLYQRAKYDEAEKATRKAMSIRQIALGSTHPSFAECVEGLASICETTGREFETEQLMKRAANIQSLYAEQAQEMAAPAKRGMQPDSQRSAPVHSILKS